MRGIFLIYGSVRTEKEADNFINFCLESGITDAFVQTDVVGEGLRVNHIPDMFSYICKNRGKLNIHAHLTMLRLWRKEHKLTQQQRPEILDEWLYINPSEYPRVCNPDGTPMQRYWCINPLIPAAQDYLVNKCKRIVKDNDVQGLYLERMYFQHARNTVLGANSTKETTLTSLLQRIVQECKAIKSKLMVSVATWQFSPTILSRMASEHPTAKLDYERLQDLPAWENIVDYLMPMIFRDGSDFDTLYNMVKDNPKYIPTLGCFNHTLIETQRQLDKIGIKDVAFFRYNRLSNAGVIENQGFKEAVR